MEKLNIRNERPSDFRAVEELTRSAFWNVYRPGCSEHFILHRFRGRPDFIPELDLVAELDGDPVAHIMFARAEIRSDFGGVIEVATFGPVSVKPELQKRGIGSALISFALKKAAEMGFCAVVITGDPGFYGRFGFIKGSRLNVRYRDDPDADYFLVKPLSSVRLDGEYADPDGYFVDEARLDEFDATFPPLKKLRLPGQLKKILK